MKVRAAQYLIMLVFFCMLSACSQGQSGPGEFGSVDLLLSAAPKGLHMSGFEGPETSEEGRWRWMVGPQSTLKFRLQESRAYVLRYALNNPLPGQKVELIINGETVLTREGMPPDPWLKPSIREIRVLQGRAGENTIVWRFSMQNHAGVVFAEKDKRPLAQVLLECKLYPAELMP